MELCLVGIVSRLSWAERQDRKDKTRQNNSIT
jgi:hypothetical protein